MLNLEISIPNEFVDNFYEDKFEDALRRLSADAHLIAGNYEQEVAKMLWMALKEARPVYPKPKGEPMEELKRCPFCGSADIYETYSQEYAYGTRRPEIFCNTCKSIFSVEDDSPYMNCDEDFKYRKEKTRETWNRRASDDPVF